MQRFRFSVAAALSRRRALALLALAGLAASRARAGEGDASIEALMAPGPLPDVVEGKADAPVTIVEYASLTCSHCARFETESWPALKAKYVEPGKVRRILREFPLDSLSVVAFMLSRCVAAPKRPALLEALFARQVEWAFVKKPFAALKGEAAYAGMSAGEIEACLADQDLYERVQSAQARAEHDLAIDSTPTFFVNGRRRAGFHTLAEFDAILAPLLQ